MTIGACQDNEPEGWYNPETGEWDKAEPELPAFMLEEEN